MSPIVQDLGRIAHFEELWLVRNIGPDAEGRQFGEMCWMRVDGKWHARVMEATGPVDGRRGGSWATRPGIRNTFRNWDYPIRRQIFSGFHCAKDA